MVRFCRCMTAGLGLAGIALAGCAASPNTTSSLLPSLASVPPTPSANDQQSAIERMVQVGKTHGGDTLQRIEQAR